MSDWKESAIRRRDERNCKSPETSRPRKRKNKDKPFKVMMKLKEGEKTMFDKPGEWVSFGRYAKRSDAEQAINSIKGKWYYNKFDFDIEDSS